MEAAVEATIEEIIEASMEVIIEASIDVNKEARKQHSGKMVEYNRIEG